MDEVMLAELARAYIRRKQWEATVLAVKILNALGGTSGGGRPRRVPAAQFLAATGAKL